MDTSKRTKKITKKDGTEVDVSVYGGSVDPKYIPEGFESQEEFIRDMREQYQADLDYDKTNREAALDDKKFVAGEQWDPQVLEHRKGLPCLVINSIPQFTAQLVGDWREGRRAVKVVPTNDSDVDVASLRGDLIRAIELKSRANRVYDSAFESLVQCGDGAFRVSVEYARDSVFDQDIFIRPIEDALSVIWDRYSVDPTGRDAKRVFVDDRIPKKEFERKWPDAVPDQLFDTQTTLTSDLIGWSDEHTYKITEYWRLIERERILAHFENEKIIDITEGDIDQLIADNGQIVRARTSWCRFAQMHLVTGHAILSGPFEYRLDRLPIIRMSGRIVNIDNRRVRYGLVRFMKDPMRLKNYWRSVDAEQLGYAPKAVWIAPASAVEGRENDFRKAHLSRDPLLIYNDDTPVPPTRVDPAPIQTALLNAAQMNTQDMKDVTGIHDASLGIRSNEVSGRAIQARQREGDVASMTFFDNANDAVLEGGDVINQLIPQVYDGTRVLLAVREDEKPRFQRVNDPMDPNSIDLSVGMFEVALTTGASFMTRRVEAAQAMMDAVQVWPQLLGIAGDLVAQAQNWPGADKLAERLKKSIPPQYLEEGEGGGPGIPPEQLQALQEQVQQLMIENQKLKMDTTAKFEKLKIDAYNAETLRIRALSDHQVDDNNMERTAIKDILDASQKLDEQEFQYAQAEAAQRASGQ